MRKELYDSSPLRARKGFTLIELLMYSALLAMVSSMLIYFLALFFRGTGTHTTASEIGNQANFVLQKIEQQIAQASFVVVNETGDDEIDALPLGQPHTKLIIKDRAETTGPPHDARSPIAIYRNPVSEAVVIKQGNQPEVTLTNPSVKATSLQFTKVSTPPGRDVILINLTLQYQSADPQQQISRQFVLGMGKANAATFDTVLNPAVNNMLDIGTSNAKWKNLFLSQNLTVDGQLFITNNGAVTNNGISFIQHGAFTANIPAISANASYTLPAQTITGARTNNQVFITPASTMPNGVVLMGASITSNDTLTVILRNTADAASTLTNNILFSYLIMN